MVYLPYIYVEIQYGAEAREGNKKAMENILTSIISKAL